MTIETVMVWAIVAMVLSKLVLWSARFALWIATKRRARYQREQCR
jgi:hypothetical protein